MKSGYKLKERKKGFETVSKPIVKGSIQEVVKGLMVSSGWRSHGWIIRPLHADDSPSKVSEKS